MRRQISQKQKLLNRLESDLQSHANAGEQKKIGDLLLANLTTAKRSGRCVTLIDYFAEDAAPLEIEVDESASLQEEAARRFKHYARSKRAAEEIASRIAFVKPEISKLEKQLSQLESDPSSIADAEPQAKAHESKEKPQRIPGTRRYLSTDGLEILVGRTSQDNDFLTFKVAKPNDLWLHAA